MDFPQALVKRRQRAESFFEAYVGCSHWLDALFSL